MNRKNAIVKHLASLPPVNDPGFPQAVRKLVERIKDPEQVLKGVVETTSVDDRVRFTALYGWLLRLRREERRSEYADVVNRYEREFGSEPYFYTFRAVVARNRGDRANLRRSIELSREAGKHLGNVAGVVHQIASLMVEYFERAVDSQKSEIEDAERYVDRAISLSNEKVAHYYETKARILAVRGEYDEARTAVNQAIELEPRDARDYHRRLTRYQTTRAKIDLLEQQSRWEEIQEESRKELREFKAQQLQLLGLLAAVVALIASVGNIVTHISLDEGIRLIQVMAGAIIVVFSTFSLMASGPLWRVGASYLVGITLLVGPIMMGSL